MLTPDTLRLALPKGRMQEGVFSLLAEAGIHMTTSARSYRPRLSLPDTESKILKPQTIVEMLAAGTRDVGFVGADWVLELRATNVVEVLDTGLDPVRLVAAVPEDAGLRPEPMVFASEYVRLATTWCEERGHGDKVVRSYGATEVLPPEDADGIVDTTATGSTLDAHGLVVAAEILTSTTRLYASARARERPATWKRIKDLAMLLRSVLEGRRRVMLELNVSPERLEAVCKLLPCMRQPTVAALRGAAGFAVKAAVPRAHLPALIPTLRQHGGSDIVISPVSQVVP